MADQMGDVAVRATDGVAVVRLERPAKLNALSRHMEARLLSVLEGPEVRSAGCVVLTGSGRAFSAGADLGDFDGLTAAERLDNLAGSGSVYERFASLAQPTIAAISGFCIGGGFELALGADIRIADDTARFDLPETALGIVTAGAAYRLTRLVGPSRAKELLLFRRTLSAREAAAFGLVSEVVDHGRLLDRSIELARIAAALPPRAARYTKTLVERVTDAPRETAVAFEQASYVALSAAAATDAPAEAAPGSSPPAEATPG